MRPPFDRLAEKLPLIAFVFVCLGGVWLYGVAAHRYGLFPWSVIQSVVQEARAGIDEIKRMSGIPSDSKWFYMERDVALVERPGARPPSPGLTLLGGMGADDRLRAWVIDADGGVVQDWTIDWFDLWPDADHIPERMIPRSRPGTKIHGQTLAPNGDLVFNFEPIGVMRLNPCGEVVWRLPILGHHSIHRDRSTGNFWVSTMTDHMAFDPRLPNVGPNFLEDTITEVSPDGETLRTISIPELLIDNGHGALLYSSSRNNWQTRVAGDFLHSNDVETFPPDMVAGVFAPGDIMISIRNLNMILVVDGETLRMKFMDIGRVLRQHDPDFIDGDAIAVFDNNNLAPMDGAQSKIVEIDARTGALREVFSGSEAFPFFSDVMGKIDVLPEGYLIADSRSGRVIEVTRSGELVWIYNNVIEPGTVALISDVERLPAAQDAAFFAAARAACGG